jgi:hypothetical protein
MPPQTHQDELLGGLWNAPAEDEDEAYPHEAVAEIQALLDELVAAIS